VVRREERELAARDEILRDAAPPPHLEGLIVILVDDGLSTDKALRAAVAALREQRPKRMVLAAPIASAAICYDLAAEVDEICTAQKPESFLSIAHWYGDIRETTDEEAQALLRDARWPRAAA
jgi:putative phosphoribosyl transferase